MYLEKKLSIKDLLFTSKTPLHNIHLLEQHSYEKTHFVVLV